MNKSGLSILEILIASVIMALVIAGLANVFLVGKQVLAHSRSRIGGAELGRYFMDPLNVDVRQDRWGSNCVGNNNCASSSRSINGVLYNVTYVASDVAASGENKLRRVIANITWTVPGA